MQAELEHSAGPPWSVLFTSPSRGDGKTTTIVGLARAFAEARRKTIVMDLDLRSPQLATALGVQLTRDTTAALSGRGRLSRALTAVPDTPNLRLAGAVQQDSGALLERAGREMPKFIVAALEIADFLLVDTAQLGERSNDAPLQVISTVDEVVRIVVPAEQPEAQEPADDAPAPRADSTDSQRLRRHGPGTEPGAGASGCAVPRRAQAGRESAAECSLFQRRPCLRRPRSRPERQTFPARERSDDRPRLDGRRRAVPTAVVEFAQGELNHDLIGRARAAFRRGLEEVRRVRHPGSAVPQEYGGAAPTPSRSARARGPRLRLHGQRADLLANAQMWACAMPLVGSATRSRSSATYRALRRIDDRCAGHERARLGLRRVRLRTTAAKRGDRYVLNGTKTFVTNAPDADVFVVFASTVEGGLAGSQLPRRAGHARALVGRRSQDGPPSSDGGAVLRRLHRPRRGAGRTGRRDGRLQRVDDVGAGLHPREYRRHDAASARAMRRVRAGAPAVRPAHRRASRRCRTGSWTCRCGWRRRGCSCTGSAARSTGRGHPLESALVSSPERASFSRASTRCRFTGATAT